MAEARDRHHTVMSSFKRGTVIIGGVEYKAAVSIMAQTFGLTDRGTKKVQGCKASVSKSLMPEPPPQGREMIVNEKSFKIDEIDGFDSGDQDWHLMGSRTPGGDEVAG